MISRNDLPTLTVKEVIQELEKYDADLPVKFTCDDLMTNVAVQGVLYREYPKGTMGGTCVLLVNKDEVY